MWRHVSESVIGTAHASNGLPCQDHVAVSTFGLAENSILAVAICDGAGSARHSDRGAQEVTRFFIAEAAKAGANLAALDAGCFSEWLGSCRVELGVLAETEGMVLEDLASTLLFAVLGEDFCAFAQIGDGCWVAQFGEVFGAVTWPVHGEMAGQTQFVTSPTAAESLQFIRHDRPPLALAGFTDGLERLCLDLAAMVPHVPFFRPVFDAIRSASDLEPLRGHLRDFLASEKVTSRTDDDKSLVAICREIAKHST